MEVFIDSAIENFVRDLALRAEGVLDDRWNGWLRPLATAVAVQEFLEAWKANDPNGTWGHVEEKGGLLVAYSDGEVVDEFPMVGVTASGEMVYDLTGWLWTAKREG